MAKNLLEIGSSGMSFSNAWSNGMRGSVAGSQVTTQKRQGRPIRTEDSELGSMLGTPPFQQRSASRYHKQGKLGGTQKCLELGSNRHPEGPRPQKI